MTRPNCQLLDEGNLGPADIMHLVLSTTPLTLAAIGVANASKILREMPFEEGTELIDWTESFEQSSEGFWPSEVAPSAETPQMACRAIGVSEQTFYRWRTEYGGLRMDKEGDSGPDAGQADPEGGSGGKLLSPERRRRCVGHVGETLGVSERRACKVLEQPRSSQSYESVAADSLASQYGRYGYRRITAHFVLTRTHNGKAVRMLALIDEYTRECLAIRAGRHFRSNDVLHCLIRLRRICG